MGGRGILPGFMSNLAPSEATLASWLRGYGGFVVFHPLRIVAGGCPGAPGKQPAKSYDEVVGILLDRCGRRLERDAYNLRSRARAVLSRVGEDSGIVRVVLHTEYEIPLWCSEEFRRALVEAGGKAVEALLEVVSGSGFRGGFEVEVELHPGYTFLEGCQISVYKSGGIYVRCRRAGGDPGEALRCLGEAVASFRERLSGLGVEPLFSLEPRGQGLVEVAARKRAPQAFATHGEALEAARRLGALLVIDPSQVKVRDGWRDALEAARASPEAVIEVHVHRGHRPPEKGDIERYAGILGALLSAEKAPPVGVVGEVTKVVKGVSMRRANLESVERVISLALKAARG